MTFLEVLILAFIEGLTEFLPVSSTGHLILAAHFMGFHDDQFVKSFNIIIQFGAILSVLVLYWRRFLPNFKFYQRLIIAFLPAAIIGLLLKDKIDLVLGSVQVVAWSLVLGGVVLIFSDRIFRNTNTTNLESMTLTSYFKLGLIQCLAFVPGVSRSGATIIAGMALGLSKKEAAEFSFFLAVPTLAGASLIKSLGVIKTIQPDQITTLLLGMFFSFVFALIAIRFFIAMVSKFGFLHFGIYRIILGGTILALFYGGII